MAWSSRWKRGVWGVLRLLLVAAVVLLILAFIPTKWMMRAPGGARAVEPMLRVPSQKAYPSMGRLYLTTVLVEPASALLCLYAMLDPRAQLVDPQGVQAPVQSALDPRMASQMQQSQYLAKVAALRQLGHRVEAEPEGVEVLDLVRGSPAWGVLQAADLIVEVAGRPVRRLEDLHSVLGGAPGGAPLSVALRRDGQALRLEVPTVDRDGRAWLGVSVRTRVKEGELPFVIDIQPGRIDGASAGLFFALGIYDRLTAQDVTHGLVVAGSGAIDADGRVGEVGSVDMKILGAEAVGARCFLCPVQNAEEARAAARSLEVVPVETLEDALGRLEELGRRAQQGDGRVLDPGKVP